MSNDPQGSFAMKFIGKPQGVYMHGAPGGYDQGKVYWMRFRHSRFAWWQLMEDAPVLKAPELKDIDDAFDGVGYVPEEDEPEEEAPIIEVEEPQPEPSPEIAELLKQIEALKTQLESKPEPKAVQGVSMIEPYDQSLKIPDPNAPAIIEPYMTVTVNPEGVITGSKVVKVIDEKPEIGGTPEPELIPITEEEYIEAVTENPALANSPVITPDPVAVEKPDSEINVLDREELKKKLDEAGIIYGAKEHTATLRKRVEELEAEE